MSTLAAMTGGFKMPARVGPRSETWPCSDGLPGHPSANVVVTVRCGNRSAFNGYRFTSSDWSELSCCSCGARWRSNARYVAALPSGVGFQR